MRRLYILAVSLVIITSCDPNHTNEFNKIARSDTAGYEQFISKYPNSTLVKDAKERIEVNVFNSIERTDITGYERFIAKYPNSTLVRDAKEIIEVEKENRRIQEEIRLEQERQRRIENMYGHNSLSNGSAPYSQWYGLNLYFDDYTPHSEIRVSAPTNSDVIAIVRYNNGNGNVAGHKYIKAGHSVTIYLRNGYNYQTFFYYGNGWYPQKEMNGNVKGGFLKNEAFSKDGSSSYLSNNILEYSLTLQQHGNFSTSGSSATEMF